MQNQKQKRPKIKSTTDKRNFADASFNSPRNHNHFQSSTRNSDEIWLCGKHPTFSALEKKRRKIFEILTTKNSITELEKFLKEKSLTNFLPLVRVVDNEKIENLAGKNQVHQGLALRVSKLPIKNQIDLLEELYAFEEGKKLPTLLLLDQISDPHNVGAIIRSAVSFGVTKIIFCEHNSVKETATIVKASAGTIESVDLIVVTNFNNLLEKLKKVGYWCIGLAGEGKTKITEVKDYKNIALVIGSEGDGLRDLVKKNCDILTRIEIAPEVESLNASVAASIALYELSRK